MKTKLLFIIVLLFPILVYAEEVVPYDIKITNEAGAIAFDETKTETIIKYEEVVKVVARETIDEQEYLKVVDINNKTFYILEKDTKLLIDPTDPATASPHNDIAVDLAGKEPEKDSETGKTISSGDMQTFGEMNAIEIVFAIVGGGVTLSLILIALKNKLVLKENPNPES